MFKSLKSRLIFKFAVILTLIVIIFVVSFNYLSNLNQSNKILAQMREIELESSTKLLSKNRLTGYEIDIDLPQNSNIALIRDGKIIAVSRDYNHTICSHLIKSDKEFSLSGYEYLTACYIERFKQPFSGAVILQKKNIENESEDMREILLIVLIPVSLLLLLFIWRLIDKILKPIEMMTESIRQVRVDNFSRTIPPVTNDDEIKALTEAYNEMILRLKRGVASLEQFNSDIAHELRTPLSVILGETELALRKERSNDEYIDALKRVYGESKYLQKIIENLLLLGKYTEENISDTFNICKVDNILKDVIDRFSIKIEDKGLIIEESIETDIEMECNKTLIVAMISNLIDNAIKYSPNNSKIYISLKKYNDTMYFKILDSGNGVPKDKIDSLSKRFYRIDDARSRQVEGMGLGLSIVDKAVKLHNGNIEFDSSLGKGLRVRVYFRYKKI